MLGHLSVERVAEVAHDDAESITEAIAGLYEDAEYRRQLRYRGLSRAALFTWPRAARQIMDILESCVTAEKTPATNV